MSNLDGNPVNVRYAVVDAFQFQNSTRVSAKDDAAFKTPSIGTGEKATTQPDLRLDPTDAVFVKPNTDMLCAQLLNRSHEAQDLDHGGKGLQYLVSQL